MSDQLFDIHASGRVTSRTAEAIDVIGQADKPVIEELARLLRAGHLAFVVGSGASFGSGLPMGDGLKRELIRRVVGEDASPARVDELAGKYSLETVGSAFRESTDASRLRQVVKTIYAAKATPMPAHKHLAHFANRGNIDRIYTTNFDTLIESAISSCRAISISDENYDDLYDEDSVDSFPIFHLHGLANDRPLLAEDDMYRLDTPLGKILCADMITKWFVFLGYSMSDVDLRSLHFATTTMLGATRVKVKTQYAVHPTPDIHEHRLAQHVWKGRSIQFIDASADNFMSALRLRVEGQRDLDIARAILHRQGRDPSAPAQVAGVMEEAASLQRDIGMASVGGALEVLAARYEVDVDDVPDI